jgi:hypothetical protein
MGKIFIAENGTKLEALDETQEAAFKNAGLKEVENKKK